MSEGIEAAYRRYFPLIREKCARILGDRDEAQELAQEAFIRLWREELASAEPRLATAWIYRTATRLAIDRLRSRKRNEAQERPEERSHPSPEAALLARDALEALARQTPRDELEVALLHRFDRMGQKEIAEVLGISERTVRRLLSRFDERAGVER